MRLIESLFLDGPAGRLEALLEEPENGILAEAAPSQVALVCHPHPQHGGTMHNKVVFRLSKGLRRAGAVVLRFNYRGVNLSQGAYANGEGELDDARAALGYLRRRYPQLPFTLAGFSFGSRVALRLAGETPAPKRVFAAGFPTVYKDRGYLDGLTVPRVFVQSTHDEFGPLEELRAMVAALPEPKKLIAIEAADHFFTGALPELEDAIASVAVDIVR